MLPVLEKLLVLQDRDRQISKLQEELTHLDPERRRLQAQLVSAQKGLEAGKLKVKQLESDRKELELEVEAKKQLIERYSLQQFQTKKNEEYRALAHEIDMCKDAIVKLDDRQLELMEQAEAAQKEVAAQNQAFNAAKKALESRIVDLGARELNLKKELAELMANRGELADVVEDTVRGKYERLLKHKGSNVVVGIQHGVCGGCHMQLSRSTVVACQADQEVVACINCGRILYYTRDMNLAVAD